MRTYFFSFVSCSKLLIFKSSAGEESLCVVNVSHKLISIDAAMHWRQWVRGRRWVWLSAFIFIAAASFSFRYENKRFSCCVHAREKEREREKEWSRERGASRFSSRRTHSTLTRYTSRQSVYIFQVRFTLSPAILALYDRIVHRVQILDIPARNKAFVHNSTKRFERFVKYYFRIREIYVTKFTKDSLLSFYKRDIHIRQSKVNIKSQSCNAIKMRMRKKIRNLEM